MRPCVLIARLGCIACCTLAAQGFQAASTVPPALAAEPQAPQLPQVVVADDNTRITQSCRLILAPRALVDADDNGVIHIDGDDLIVDLSGQTLFGANHETTPRHELRGIGIVIKGKRVTVRGGVITGFRVGISGTGCDHAVLENLELVRNFAQHLGSTPEDEDPRDWLWPHSNDRDEWMKQYGAAIALRGAQGVIIREVGIRQGQNGILLSEVSHAQIYNCDASFLSGWGIALWRSSSNTICRNSLDFCVRGYSHGVYNRGQDSAGILCFEQCCDNTIMLNSVTHCGDGFFGFAGREALGEVAPALGEVAGSNWYIGRGCNRNLIALNDFSDAAAHGLELTFSFDNRILRNRFDRDAICGVWGGYSQHTLVSGNLFRNNGTSGVGAESGGINIEHGRSTTITDNTFADNSAGVRLWWDADAALATRPWAIANGVGSTGNAIIRNSFSKDGIAISLRSTTDTTIAANTMIDLPVGLDADAESVAVEEAQTTQPPADWTELMARAASLPGAGNAVEIVDGLPITKRTQLNGRGAILLGDYGPFDFIAPMTIAEPGPTNVHRWKLLGSQRIQFLQASQGQGDLRTNIEPESNTAIIETETPSHLTNYELAIFWGRAANQVQRVHGTLLSANWRVAIFPLPTPATADAPPSLDSFDQAAKTNPFIVYVDSITFPFGSGGPDDVNLMQRPASIPPDNFGIRATTTFSAPPGDWIVQTRSDDGIRVSLDGEVLINHWDRHGLAQDRGRFSITAAREVTMTVDYFELGGSAALDLRILPAPKQPTIPEAISP
ncbi:MAG: hypothetical protein EXS01_01435 [Phycisphaerales bacterium]|nr:hypothetical protein [Phycisphaerales bacterium]